MDGNIQPTGRRRGLERLCRLAGSGGDHALAADRTAERVVQDRVMDQRQQALHALELHRQRDNRPFVAVIPNDAVVLLGQHRVGFLHDRPGVQLTEIPDVRLLLHVEILRAPDIEADLCLDVLLGFPLDVNHRAVGIHPKTDFEW